MEACGMTDLDREIAEKVMGFEWLEGWKSWIPKGKNYFEDLIHEQHWHPTLDISQAFMVVEKMIERGYMPKMIFDFVSKKYRFTFSKSNSEPRQPLISFYEAKDEKLPLAICQATLKAIS